MILSFKKLKFITQKGGTMKKYVLIILTLFLFSGCFSTQRYTYTPAINPDNLYTDYTYNNLNVSEQLITHFKKWQGVKYKYGGNSKNGVDCSYFVQDSLKNIQVSVPRTTYYQAKLGQMVSRTQLQTGDLVFFKTSSKDRHVGIYLNKGHFMHVSTSKGVIISRMDNPYWNRHYWKSKRILQ